MYVFVYVFVLFVVKISSLTSCSQVLQRQVSRAPPLDAPDRDPRYRFLSPDEQPQRRKPLYCLARLPNEGISNIRALRGSSSIGSILSGYVSCPRSYLVCRDRRAFHLHCRQNSGHSPRDSSSAYPVLHKPRQCCSRVHRRRYTSMSPTT